MSQHFNRPQEEPDVIPLEDEPRASKPIVCRMCFTRRDTRESPCPRCGFDERQGLRASTTLGSQPLGASRLKCASCGYDLTGLPSPRCPECGQIVAPMSRRDRERETAKETTREAYRTPLLMFGIAGGLMTALLFALYGSETALFYLMQFVFEVPVGVIAFLVCCLLWLGFDAPIHLIALRLAGIYAVVDLVGVGAGLIPLPFVGWVITLFVYIGLLSEMLEMDLTDAMMVGVLTFFAKLGAGILILAIFGT